MTPKEKLDALLSLVFRAHRPRRGLALDVADFLKVAKKLLNLETRDVIKGFIEITGKDEPYALVYVKDGIAAPLSLGMMVFGNLDGRIALKEDINFLSEPPEKKESNTPNVNQN